MHECYVEHYGPGGLIDSEGFDDIEEARKKVAEIAKIADVGDRIIIIPGDE